jgi:hypothetical protein
MQAGPPPPPPPGADKKDFLTHYNSMNNYVLTNQLAEYMKFISTLEIKKTKITKFIISNLNNRNLSVNINVSRTGLYINLRDKTRTELGKNGTQHPYQLGHISFHFAAGPKGGLGAFHIHNDETRKSQSMTHSKRYIFQFVNNGSLNVSVPLSNLILRGVLDSTVNSFEYFSWQAISSVFTTQYTIQPQVPPPHGAVAGQVVTGTSTAATGQVVTGTSTAATGQGSGAPGTGSAGPPSGGKQKGGYLIYTQFKEVFLTLHKNDGSIVPIYITKDEDEKVNIISEGKDTIDDKLKVLVEWLFRFIDEITDAKYVTEDLSNNNSKNSASPSTGGKRRKTRKHKGSRN